MTRVSHAVLLFNETYTFRFASCVAKAIDACSARWPVAASSPLHDFVRLSHLSTRFGLSASLTIFTIPSIFFTSVRIASGVQFLRSDAERFCVCTASPALPEIEKQIFEEGSYMHSATKGFWAVLFLVPLMLGGSVFSNEPADPVFGLNRAAEAVVDDEVPDVTARVARISFIRGDVQIRRPGMEDWERANVNLPIVEGDEIATDANARFEIQFNSSTYMRVAENAYVKIIGLKDEGIAVSLPQGSVSVRIHDIEGDKTFFEIDAPKTTVAVQRAGLYRVDAGQKEASEVRVSVSEDGEARVYSESSGFTLKNGRSARIFIDGDNAGESEIADASAFRDDFDSWIADREAIIEKSLKDAYYGKYYDRDIYGAEDLNDHGEWVHTTDYGYIWRPYQSSIGVYADWSPYRYGHWRWIPPYGWTWVNDEPWGWATYHHGRWFYLNGRWCWSPYGYYRGRRSWWRPALVSITIINNNVCWWPLSYHHRYRNYNRRHRRDRRDRDDRARNYPPRTGPSPTPTPGERQDGPLDPRRRGRILRVPTSGVIMAESGDIETGRRRYRTPSIEVATTILSQDTDVNTSGPGLPVPDRTRVNRDSRVEAPRIIRRSDPSVRVGAGERTESGPLDDVLRRTRIYGNRTPRQTGEGTTVVNGERRRPDTGAVDRPTIPRADTPVEPGRREVPRADRRQRPTEQEPPQTPPIVIPPRTDKQPAEPRSKPQEPPTERPRREDTPVERPQRPYEPPSRREEPRNDTPAPRVEPRPDPPQRSEPKPDPPSKREDPPAKSEPSRPSPSERKGKEPR